MKIRDFVDLLKTFDQDLPVAYKIFSEQCLLEADDISVQELCVARNDGWVADKRPDKESILYLVLPGN